MKKTDNETRPLLLIVDDNVRNLQVIGSALYKQNYQISMADSAENALKLLENIKPDLILLDISMPGKDGLQLCREIKAEDGLKNIPVIFLTARTETEDILDAFDAGGVDYITKPFNSLELIARIQTHLDLKFSREVIEKNIREIEDANAKLIQLNLLKDRYLSILKTDLSSAANYVRKLLPEKINNRGLKTDWIFTPSAELGGDSFGYHWIDEEHFAIYLLDVSGHGVSAALESVSVLNMLRQQTLVKTDFRDPEQVIKALNKAYQMTEHNNNYFTIWYAVYHSQSRILKYCSAGHPPPIIIDSFGKAEELVNKNHPVGFLPDNDFQGSEIHINSGLSLYIFSDGVFEIKNENKIVWNYYDFRDFLINSYKKKISELKLLFSYVKQSSGENKLRDDFSILKVSFEKE